MVYIFEGMDNCLKDTLIDKFRKILPPQTQVLKYSKPPQIDQVMDWQMAHFTDMFNLLQFNLNFRNHNFILNRAHLGEYVYSPIYRDYNGQYVLRLESEFMNSIDPNKIVLFLLYDSNNQGLKDRDDGKSLSGANFDNLNRERERFLDVFEKSNIIRKEKFDLSQYQDPFKENVIDTDSIINRMGNI